MVVYRKLHIFVLMEKKSIPKRTNLFSWHSYFGSDLSSKAWKKMKELGVTSQSQFVVMAVKKFVDNDGAKQQ